MKKLRVGDMDWEISRYGIHVVKGIENIESYFTNDIVVAQNHYQNLVDKYHNSDVDFEFSICIFDYDNNVDFVRYDSAFDRC